MWTYLCFVAVGFLGSRISGIEVEIYKSVCLTESSLFMKCPEEHSVVIRSAYYYKSRREGCITTTPDRCKYADMITPFRAKCIVQGFQAVKGECTLPFVTPGSDELVDPNCYGYDGDPYLEIAYHCNAGYDQEENWFDMCTPGTWTHSTFRIHNTGYPQYTQQPVCSCTMELRSEVEMELQLGRVKAVREDANYTSTQMEKLQKTTCPTSLQFWSGEQMHKRCCEDPADLSDIDIDVKNTFWIQFNNLIRLKSSFNMHIRVHHDEKMNITCGPVAIPTTIASSALQSTVAPQHETSEVTSSSAETTEGDDTGKTDDDDTGVRTGDGIKIIDPHSSKSNTKESIGIWPVICGGVGAATVLIIIVVGLALFCRKKKRSKEQKKEGKAETDKYAYDNAVYMSNKQVARLRGSESSQQAKGNKSKERKDRKSRSGNTSQDRGPLPPIIEKSRDISPSRISTISEVPSCDSFAMPFKPGAEISFNTHHGKATGTSDVHVQLPPEKEEEIFPAPKEGVTRQLSVRDKIKLLEAQQLQ